VRKAWQKERIERPLVVMRGLAGLTGAVILLLLVAGNWGKPILSESTAYEARTPITILPES
jgi:hypothetical protein